VLKAKTYIGVLLGLFSLFSVASWAAVNKAPDTFTVKIGNFTKVYDVMAPKGDTKVKIVYISDFCDNIKMAESVSLALVEKLKEADLLKDIDVVVLPGDKANMLGALLFEEIRKAKGPDETPEFCIFRSAEKAQPLHSVNYASITGGGKKLHMRKDQAERIANKRVLIFDDVVSTGGTFNATKALVEKCGCKVVGYACVAVEGDVRTNFDGKPLINLINLPVYVQK
jgi:adenine/guanine phosphoribosyltransferase-like PRPP-binding protein